MSEHFTLSVNGTQVSATCRPDTTVLTWLRTHLRLTGTKEGCAEGDCGACSVLVSKTDDTGFFTANSCILAMGQVAGRNLITVEGLSQTGEHPIQTAMAENGSSQCGFCTPGIVVSLAGLLANSAEPSEPEIHDALAGNLCRCTGYKPIIEAAKKIAKSGAPALSLLPFSQHWPQQIIQSSSSAFHVPNTLAELYALREKFPNAQLLAGGTDLGVALAGHAVEWPVIIWTAAVKELLEIKEDANHWHFGAALTWSQILANTAQDLPSLAVLLRRFGSTQIRNLGTIGGNFATASPIGDGPPAFIALGATITLATHIAERTIPLEEFFLDYRKTALQAGEIIKSITLPKPAKNQVFRVWKISKRYDQDISTLCGAFNLIVHEGVITSARVAFGGMAAIPCRAPRVEAALSGLHIKTDNFATVAKAISESFTPLSDWRGTAQYRAQVACNLIFRLHADLNGEPADLMSLEGV